jgi:hypothetical protein
MMYAARDEAKPDPAVPAPVISRGTAAGYAFAAMGAMLFSGKAIFVKLAYAQSVDPETLLALRMGLSLPCYLVVGFWLSGTGGTSSPRCRREEHWYASPWLASSACGWRVIPIFSDCNIFPRSSNG